MLFEMFTTFFKIGAFSFGGGYAMIPVVYEEMVTKREWIEEEEFLDAIAVAQGSPGAMAINMSIYVGYKIKGVKGALVATLGSILPSFLIILLVAKYLYQYRNNPLVDKAFIGIKPAIVALIVSAVYNLGKSARLPRGQLVITALTVILIGFLNVNPIYLILAGGIGSVIYNKFFAQDI